MGVDPPSIPAIRSALRACRPDLAKIAIQTLGEGWDFWAFRVGDRVVRFARSAEAIGKLETEMRLLPVLAARLPLAIPVPELLAEPGETWPAFAISPLIGGVPLSRLGHAPASTFSRGLGQFLRALHAFPIEEARTLGIEVYDGARTRTARLTELGTIASTLFPLLSARASAYAQQCFAAYFDEAANFHFNPVLTHADVGPNHLYVDPGTGELIGVIDWGDLVVGDPAEDLHVMLLDPELLALDAQLVDFGTAYGVMESVETLRPRAQFLRFKWICDDALVALRGDDQAQVASTLGQIEALAEGA